MRRLDHPETQSLWAFWEAGTPQGILSLTSRETHRCESHPRSGREVLTPPTHPFVTRKEGRGPGHPEEMRKTRRSPL